MSESMVLEKLDDLKEGVADLTTDVALNHQAYHNLNAELQEHKNHDKWVATRNIAIVAIMFTALGCWVGFKGLNTNKKNVQPTAIIKEITSHDRSSHRN